MLDLASGFKFCSQIYFLIMVSYFGVMPDFLVVPCGFILDI